MRESQDVPVFSLVNQSSYTIRRCASSRDAVEKFADYTHTYTIHTIPLYWWRDMVPRDNPPRDNVPQDNPPRRQCAPEKMCPGDSPPWKQPAPEITCPGRQHAPRQSAPGTTCLETMFPGDIMPRRQSAPVSKYIIGTLLC